MLLKVSNSVVRFVFWISVSGISILALVSPAIVSPVMVFSDKIMHAGAFFVLGTLALWAYPDSKKIVFIGLLLYGGVIELAQSTIANRSPEWMDWLADILGLAFALPADRLRYLFVK